MFGKMIVLLHINSAQAITQLNHMTHTTTAPAINTPRQAAQMPSTLRRLELTYIDLDAKWRAAQNEATLLFEWDEDGIQCPEFFNLQAIADEIFVKRLEAWREMDMYRETQAQISRIKPF